MSASARSAYFARTAVAVFDSASNAFSWSAAGLRYLISSHSRCSARTSSSTAAFASGANRATSAVSEHISMARGLSITGSLLLKIGWMWRVAPAAACRDARSCGWCRAACAAPLSTSPGSTWFSRAKNFSGMPSRRSRTGRRSSATSSSATCAGASIAVPSSALSAESASSFSAVRVARGAKYRTRTGPSASSRRSASVKPRSANLLAL